MDQQIVFHGVKYDAYYMQHDLSSLHPILTFLQTGSVEVAAITDGALILADQLDVNALKAAVGLRTTINEGMTHVAPGSKFKAVANAASLVKSGTARYLRHVNADSERDVVVLHRAKFDSGHEHHQNILDGETNKLPANAPSAHDVIFILSPTTLARDPKPRKVNARDVTQQLTTRHSDVSFRSLPLAMIHLLAMALLPASREAVGEELVFAFDRRSVPLVAGHLTSVIRKEVCPTLPSHKSIRVAIANFSKTDLVGLPAGNFISTCGSVTGPLSFRERLRVQLTNPHPVPRDFKSVADLMKLGYQRRLGTVEFVIRAFHATLKKDDIRVYMLGHSLQATLASGASD